MAQQIEQAAFEASISTLSDVQVLTLYNYCVRNDVDRSDALEARANAILDSDRVVGYDDKGKELHAVSYLDELDAAYNTKAYNELLKATQKTINEIASKEQDNINWYRDNYAAAIAEYNEQAEIIKKNLGVDLNFEAGTAYTSAWSNNVTEYNELFKKYNTADGKGSTLDAESLSAISRMKEITDELEAHSFIGKDRLLQQTGARDENSVSAYYGSGNGGTANDQQGIGQSDIGTGIGAGGSGNGTGSGVGDGDGDGGTVEAKKGGYNSNGTPIETEAVKQTDNSKDVNAIESYLTMINDDAPINHIFHNSFYQNDPVAHWSFSIDFIPAVRLANSNVDLHECGQRLTKAVIAASIPDRNVKSTVSHYKGMSIELPARAKTAGTLTMRFAETNTFPISSILNQLYQFARSDTYFESIDNVLASLETEEQIAKYKQILRAYRQSIPDGGHLYNILVKMYKMQDVRAFGEDEDIRPTFVYYFVGCDLQTVNQIDFNYDDDKPIDVSCVWVYQYFEELSFNEYKQRYGAGAQPVSTDNYVPNGNVEAGALDMEGNPRAHQEAVEYMYRQDINRSDLEMFANDNWEQIAELDAIEIE